MASVVTAIVTFSGSFLGERGKFKQARVILIGKKAFRLNLFVRLFSSSSGCLLDEIGSCHAGIKSYVKTMNGFGGSLHWIVKLFWQRARILFIVFTLYITFATLERQSIKHCFRGYHILVSSPAEFTVRLCFLVL